MKLKEIADLLGAQVLCGEDNLEVEVNSACASDMMSDVLAFVKEQSVLLTGLNNPQVIRTAEMMDMRCIVFTRGKTPDDTVVTLGKQKDIVIMSTKQRMYEACGKLYLSGLRGAGLGEV